MSDKVTCMITSIAGQLGTGPETFYTFLSGEGGMGKTYNSRHIPDRKQAFKSAEQDPEKPTILLTAPTRKAAINISGTTLHSAFSIPVKDKGQK